MPRRIRRRRSPAFLNRAGDLRRVFWREKVSTSIGREEREVHGKAHEKFVKNLRKRISDGSRRASNDAFFFNGTRVKRKLTSFAVNRIIRRRNPSQPFSV